MHKYLEKISQGKLLTKPSLLLADERVITSLFSWLIYEPPSPTPLGRSLVGPFILSYVHSTGIILYSSMPNTNMFDSTLHRASPQCNSVPEAVISTVAPAQRIFIQSVQKYLVRVVPRLYSRRGIIAETFSEQTATGARVRDPQTIRILVSALYLGLICASLHRTYVLASIMYSCAEFVLTTCILQDRPSFEMEESYSRSSLKRVGSCSIGFSGRVPRYATRKKEREKLEAALLTECIDLNVAQQTNERDKNYVPTLESALTAIEYCVNCSVLQQKIWGESGDDEVLQILLVDWRQTITRFPALQSRWKAAVTQALEGM